MNPNENNSFQYSYSAKEQAELKKIREKYLPDTDSCPPSTIDRIRRLDAGVTRKGTVIALILGIIGTLTMGLGMSLIMTDLQSLLGASRETALIIGILIGFVGMLSVIAAHPLYQRITDKERQKLAPEILRLTDELMHENR